MGTKPSIGFIGLGVMGKSMARNLRKAGFPVLGYARHPQKVEDLVQEGLSLTESPAELAEKADLIISMVGMPKDVEDIYLAEDGILNHLAPGKMAVDMTTSDPKLARKLADLAARKGVDILDAPVTGGDAGAKNGTLTILAGGKPETYEKLLPVFQAMGTNIRYMGEAGAGQSAKLVNQILISGAMAGLAEAWAYAKAQDLDPALLYEALHEGAAASKSLDLYWPRLLQNDKQPGFFIKHFIKDMKLAQKQAKEADLSLPVLDQVLAEYQSIQEDELGTQALVDFYEGNNA